MMNGNEFPPTTFITTRHTQKTKTAEEGSQTSGILYPGVTPKGEDIVRERTGNELLPIIESAPSNAVIAFAGASDLVRTQSSSRISGDELKKLLHDRPEEYLVLDETDINHLVTDRSKESTIEKLKQLVASNNGKKVVITYPLAIRELSLVEGQATMVDNVIDWKTGGSQEVWKPYLTEIMKRNNNDEVAVVKDWINNGGMLIMRDGSVVRAPTAEQVVQDYINSLRRLEALGRKLFPDRPLVIEVTGHSWEIDVLITYLANHGSITAEAFETIAKGSGDVASIIAEFEFSVIKRTNNEHSITYRGKTYSITVDDLK